MGIIGYLTVFSTNAVMDVYPFYIFATVNGFPPIGGMKRESRENRELFPQL
jgi:hypothetical protein